MLGEYTLILTLEEQWNISILQRYGQYQLQLNFSFPNIQSIVVEHVRLVLWIYFTCLSTWFLTSSIPKYCKTDRLDQDCYKKKYRLGKRNSLSFCFWIKFVKSFTSVRYKWKSRILKIERLIGLLSEVIYHSTWSQRTGHESECVICSRCKLLLAISAGYFYCMEELDALAIGCN